MHRLISTSLRSPYHSAPTRNEGTARMQDSAAVTIMNDENTFRQRGRPRQRLAESRLKSPPPPNLIRFYRQRADMSLEVLARNLQLSRETVRRLEERDIWLEADRAAQISKVLGVPKEVLAFSQEPNAYTWAAKAVPLIGSVIAEDEVRYRKTGRRVFGRSYLPATVVALDIQHGKLHGWLLFSKALSEPMTQNVLERQGNAEKFIAGLKNRTQWWRHIKPASDRNRFHLNSPYLSPIQDAEIFRVWEIVGLEAPLFDFPSDLG